MGLATFSQSFRILYIYHVYGIIEGGFYLTIVGLVTFLFDYPTANLSDRIGQRGVIILALATHSIAMFILATMNSLNGLFLTAIIEGFALAQFSGTLKSWLDNNYKKIAEKEDKEYKIYLDLINKIQVSSYTGAFCFSVFGGYIALEYSRIYGLLVESALSIILVFLLLFLMGDIARTVSKIEERKNSSLKNFKEGLKFLVASKENFLLILSASMLSVLGVIFTRTMFIPIYYGYTGSELLISFLDKIQVLITLFVQLFVMKIIVKKVKNMNDYVYFFVLGLLMFAFIPILVNFYPTTTDKLFVVPLTLLWFIYLFLDLFNLIGFTFLNRKIAISIPSEIRNSVYSLISSINTFFVLILLPIVSLIFYYSLLMGLVFLIAIHIVALIVTVVEKLYTAKLSIKEKSISVN